MFIASLKGMSSHFFMSFYWLVLTLQHKRTIQLIFSRKLSCIVGETWIKMLQNGFQLADWVSQLPLTNDTFIVTYSYACYSSYSWTTFVFQLPRIEPLLYFWLILYMKELSELKINKESDEEPFVHLSLCNDYHQSIIQSTPLYFHTCSV